MNMIWAVNLLFKGVVLSAFSNLALYGCVLALSHNYDDAVVVWIQGAIVLWLFCKISKEGKKKKK